MLQVTSKAREKLKKVLQEQTADPEVAIRITSNYVRPNRLDLVLDKEKKGDHVVKSEDGIKVLLIRSELSEVLDGMVLDYKETFQGSDFILAKLTRH